MGESSYKQDSFPLCEVLGNVLPEFLIHIGHNVFHIDLAVQGLDGLPLHVGGIVGHRCLVHQCQLYGAPVRDRFPLLRIPGQLKLPALPQEVQVMAIVNNLDIGIFFYKINVSGSDMGTVQIGKLNIISMLLKPVPDT